MSYRILSHHVILNRKAAPVAEYSPGRIHCARPAAASPPPQAVRGEAAVPAPPGGHPRRPPAPQNAGPERGRAGGGAGAVGGGAAQAGGGGPGPPAAQHPPRRPRQALARGTGSSTGYRRSSPEIRSHGQLVTKGAELRPTG